MIDFGPFQFASAPRTATTWILNAAYAAGLGEFSKSYVHMPFPVLRRREVLPFKVSMVRHPYDWLASYYGAIKQGHTSVPAVDIFQSLPHGTFDVFVQGYLREMPGAIYDVFAFYGADSYLKVEDLPWCFIETLGMFGISEQRRMRCAEITRQNWCSNLPKYEEKHKQAIIKAEKRMMERFEYL